MTADGRPRTIGAAATRAGSADLPLHGGRVPRRLAERMSRLGRVIVEAIVVSERIGNARAKQA